jgi:hypothetical protein
MVRPEYMSLERLLLLGRTLLELHFMNVTNLHLRPGYVPESAPYQECGACTS